MQAGIGCAGDMGWMQQVVGYCWRKRMDPPMGIAALVGSIAVEAGRLAMVHGRTGYKLLLGRIAVDSCRSIAVAADRAAADAWCSTCWLFL